MTVLNLRMGHNAVTGVLGSSFHVRPLLCYFLENQCAHNVGKQSPCQIIVSEAAVKASLRV